MPNIRNFASVDVAAGYAPPPSAAEEADILREMLLRLPDAVAYVDADGTMRLVNDAFLQIHAIDRTDLAHLRTPESRFRWQFENGRQTLTHATIEESVAHMLARRAEPDGRPNLRQYNDQWFDHRFIALPEGRTMVLFRDITELKRQEAETRETLDYLRAFNTVLQAMSRSAFDLETVLRTVVSSAAGFCRAERAILYRYRDGACHFEVGHNLPPDYEVLERSQPILPNEDTVAGRALLRRHTVQISDAQTDPAYGPKKQAVIGRSGIVPDRSADVRWNQRRRPSRRRMALRRDVPCPSWPGRPGHDGEDGDDLPRARHLAYRLGGQHLATNRPVAAFDFIDDNPGDAAHGLPLNGDHGVGHVLDHLPLLDRIEHTLDEVDANQRHGTLPG